MTRSPAVVRRRVALSALSIVIVALGALAVRAQGDAAQQKIAAIRQSLQTSVKALRGYEWIETVTVSKDGEQRSRKDSRCYYGADGQKEKIPIDDGSESKARSRRGLRGRLAEQKKEEMEEYVQKVLDLVKSYVPPDPARLQAIKEAGAQKLEVLDGATRLRAEFPAYLKKGDLLSVDIDPDADGILGVSVSSYLEDDPEDGVTLEVTFGVLQDGTSYPEKTELRGESQGLDILIENHGYRKTGP